MQTEDCRPGVKVGTRFSRNLPVVTAVAMNVWSRGVAWGRLGSNTTYSGQSTQDVMVSVLSFICEGNKF